MFKRIISKYFGYKFSKRFLILSLVFALLFAGIDLFVNGTINRFFPNKEVYAHFNELAGDIIEQQSYGFLEKNDILNYYTVTIMPHEKTFAITLYGCRCNFKYCYKSCICRIKVCFQT